MREGINRRVLWTAALLAAAAGPAFAAADAQPAGGGSPGPATTAAATPEDKDIVVTGSRILRRETDSIAPLQVIDSAYLDTRGFSTIAQALNELPAFGVPGSSPVGFGQSAFGAGQSFVNFLGLGSQRTLTLVNGRRFVSSNTGSIFGPTGAGGNQVDLNTIPTKLIDRVETVVAIGAPIYGSDAIAGTINILLKRNFQGLDIDAQYGTSDLGDATDYRVRALAGVNFADGRGNLTVAGEYQKSNGLRFTDRRVTRSDDRFDNAATPGAFAQVPYRDLRVPSIATTGIPLVTDFIVSSAQQSNLFFGDPALSAGVQNAAGQTLRFAADGSLQPIDFGSTIGPAGGFSLFTSGGNGYSLPSVQNLLTDLNRYNANANLNFEISPKLRLFAEGWYSHSEGRNLAAQPSYQYAFFDGAGRPDGQLIIPLSNPFLSAPARAAIAGAIASNPLADSATQDYFYLTRANFDLTPGVSVGAVDLVRFVAGAAGSVRVLPERDWNYEVSFNYGQSITRSRNPSLVQQNFENALNATRDASGSIVCAPGAVASPIPTLSSTCAPLNPFGSQISAAARDYVTTIATPRNRNEQIDVIASISGPLFQLPGGPAAFALGYEHREESSRFTPGEFLFGRPDPANPGTRTSYGRNTPVDPVYGRFVTNELFGEFNLDLVSAKNNVPFVRTLQVQTAARYIWNTQAGQDLTWTAGLKYAPAAFLSFRGAYTRAVRAPSVTEAFNPRSSSFVFATDPCDQIQRVNGPDPATRQRNCAAAGVPAAFNSLSNQRSIRGFTFGNDLLTNEKSDNFTVGAVFTPSFLRGFEATVDYVDITLSNAISQFTPTQVANACYDAANFPSNIFCSLVSRTPDSQLSEIGTTFFNSATLQYRGILGNIRYRHASPLLGAASNITVGLSYQYLDNLSEQVTSGSRARVIDNSIGYSRHKGVLTLNYDNGPFFFQTQVQYIGSAKIDPNAPANFYSIPDVREVAFVNMSVSYDIRKYVTVRASVDNVLDATPPFPGSLYNGVDGQNVYFSGIVGRFVRVGAAVHF